MITQVKFPNKGVGYLYEVPKKPTKPNKNSFEYRIFNFDTANDDFDEKKYNRDYADYEKRLKFYNEHKGEFICPASQNLVDKTFNFEPKKVNLIFGPNGSGKTTILKAIAGTAFCEDGFTETPDALDLGFKWNDKDGYTQDDMLKLCDTKKGNTSNVVWDGAPIYYHNLEHRARFATEIGAMCGSVFTELEEEIQYMFGMRTASMGQQSMFIINKLIAIIAKNITVKNIIEPQIEKYKDRFYEDHLYDTIKGYFAQYENYDKSVPMTILFDELDKSLDIKTVWELYSVVFPKLCEKFGVQIICISHNPLVLTKEIQEHPLYNVINVDEKYSAEVKEMLNNKSF